MKLAGTLKYGIANLALTMKYGIENILKNTLKQR
jgi:hypothetical protein